MARANRKSLHTFFAFILGFALCNFLNGVHYLTKSNVDNTLATSLSNDETVNQNALGNVVVVDDGTEVQRNIQSGMNANEVMRKKNEEMDGSQSNTLIEEETDSLSSLSSMTSSYDSFCSLLSKNQTSAIPSTISLWKKYTNSIFHATKHGQDTEFIWHDYTAKLFNIMTPQRLQASMKTIAKTDQQWEAIGDIIQIGFERWKYLDGRTKKQEEEEHSSKNKRKNKIKDDKNAPRKINILVMGGSVTMGVQCLYNPVQDTSRFARRDCAWPSRINQFFNIVLGYNPDDIFHIDVLTLGGTNTDTATTIWDYTLMPKDIPYPDIIIHGYATNDMHVLSSIEAQKRGITLDEMILQVNQKFIRKVLTPKAQSSSSSKCYHRPPILIYYDDYIGNEQRKILDTNAFSKAAHILSSYYGFSLLSYADTVKDMVYSDTKETWFSPHGWPERQVHPGMGMHIVSTWIFAFHFVHMASTYCSLYSEVVNDHNRSSERNISESIWKEKKYVPRNGLPNLLQPEFKLEGEPKIYDHSTLAQSQNDMIPILPPELNEVLTLDDISEKWTNEAFKYSSSNQNHEQCNIHDNTSMPRPCTYSWVGNLERKFDKTKHLEDRMKKVLLTNNGWKASDDNNKLGYVATKAGAVFEMELKQLDSEVKTLNFMYMKSYGEKWDDSKVRVDVLVTKTKPISSKSLNVVEKTLEMTGSHDKNTSETYTSQLDLNDDGMNFIVEKNDELKLRFTLIGGSTFKIMGMAFCDH